MRDALRMLLALGVVMGAALLGDALAPAAGPGGEVAGGVDVLGVEIDRPGRGLIDSGADVGLMMLGAWLLGRLVGAASFPKIVGYLAFGAVVGPSVLGVISKGELGTLELVNDLAIALIALTAGGEIRLEVLRRSARIVTWVTGLEMLVVFAGGTALAWFLLPRLTELGGETGGLGPHLAIATVVGCIAITNSPAVLLAVITETGIRSRMSQISLAVTVCKDLLLVILFTVVMAVAGAVVLGGGDGGGAAAEGGKAGKGAGEIVMYLAQHLLGSIAAGLVIGAALGWAAQRLRQQLGVFIVLVCFGIALLSERLGLETLIVAVVAGMLMENVWGEKSAGFFETLEDLSTPVFCVFFAVAGAKLDLAAVREMWPWALLFIGVRGVLVWSGTLAGVKAAGVGGKTGRWLWTALVPQAGISLALLTIFEETFREESFAGPVFTLLLAVIGLQKIAAPLLLKVGLERSAEEGEDEPGGDGDDDGDGDGGGGPEEGGSGGEGSGRGDNGEAADSLGGRGGDSDGASRVMGEEVAEGRAG